MENTDEFQSQEEQPAVNENATNGRFDQIFQYQMLINDQASIPQFNCAEIGATVGKIRGISKFVSKSDKALRKLRCKTKLRPIIDCKTRWDSLHDMIDRFLLIENELHHVYVDLKKTWNITKSEIDHARILAAVLEPCKAFVKKMSAEKRTLIFADVAGGEMLNNAKNILEAHPNNSFIKGFYTALKKRFLDRRTELTDVLLFLCKDKINLADHQFYTEPSTSTIVEYVRFFEHEHTVDDVEPASKQPKSAEEVAAIDFYTPPVTSSATSLESAILNWQVNSILDARLQALKISLLNVQPTSTDCERSFSIAGLIMIPRRNRMKQDLLNAIFFLKNFFD